MTQLNYKAGLLLIGAVIVIWVFFTNVTQAMVIKYSSISTRKLSKNLMLITSNKYLVATSDYGDYHKMVKRYILESILGKNAQRRSRSFRDTMIQNIVNILHADLSYDPTHAVNFREPFESELFQLSMKQVIGSNIESIYVEELGVELSKKELLDILVIDPAMTATNVDWRDFFPFLRWVPNRSMENKMNSMAARKRAVTKALITERRKHIAKDITDGEENCCYVDYLLSKEQTLTEEQLISLAWEAIIEICDTTLVTTEWAMYELSKNQKDQEHLYQEIQEICGSEKLTEEHLPMLPYLNAVFHETLRYHTPIPLITPRHVHENTQLGGYNIPAGTDIIFNLFACNMDKNVWDKPSVWDPKRFLSGKFDLPDLYKTMSFGGGRRVCAGSSLAMLISTTVIGRFVQEFQWRLKDGQDENVNTMKLSNTKLHPMHAYITPRGAGVRIQE